MSIKILVEFLAGDTPYRPGDVVWIDEKDYERLLKQKKVKKYEESMFFPLEGRSIKVEGEKENLKLEGQKIKLPKQKNSLICPICGFKAKTKTGLAAHKRKHFKK